MPEAVRQSSIDAARVGVQHRSNFENFQLTRCIKEKKEREKKNETKNREKRINNEKG